MAKPLIFTFLGPWPSIWEEQVVEGARRAATLDSLERALATGAYERAVIITPDPEPLEAVPSGVHVEVAKGPFHFGLRLQEAVERWRPEALVYVGGGALPLLSADEWAAVALALADGRAVTNNLYSSDLIGVCPARSLLSVEPPKRDNALARSLAQAGLSVWEMPRTLSTVFDLDTPADVAVLKVTGYASGYRLSRWASRVPLDTRRYHDLLKVLVDSEAQLFVAGRVGSHIWRFLEVNTACRVRLLAEERGLEALGLQQPRSLLGFLWEALGEETLAALLHQLGDAAVIDTRVLMAHLGVKASRRDRFLSDMGRFWAIEDGRLRRLTSALVRAEVPVLLGGHSLVTGGLMALVQFAWQQQDKGQLR